MAPLTRLNFPVGMGISHFAKARESPAAFGAAESSGQRLHDDSTSPSDCPLDPVPAAPVNIRDVELTRAAGHSIGVPGFFLQVVQAKGNPGSFHRSDALSSQPRRPVSAQSSTPHLDPNTPAGPNRQSTAPKEASASSLAC